MFKFTSNFCWLVFFGWDGVLCYEDRGDLMVQKIRDDFAWISGVSVGFWTIN